MPSTAKTLKRLKKKNSSELTLVGCKNKIQFDFRFHTFLQFFFICPYIKKALLLYYCLSKCFPIRHFMTHDVDKAITQFCSTTKFMFLDYSSSCIIRRVQYGDGPVWWQTFLVISHDYKWLAIMP